MALADSDGEEFELEYETQEVRLSDDDVYRVTTIANEALPLEMLLELEARREEISGQRLWEGSLLLSDCLLRACRQRDVDVRGRSVLELGAGTGLAGMVAHRAGAAAVAVTDGDARCVLLMERNLRENAVPPGAAIAAQLLWGDTRTEASLAATLAAQRGESGEAWPCPPFDIILAGDVLYKKGLVAPLLETARRLLARPAGVMLLCHVPRAGVTHAIVELALDAVGLSFQASSPAVGAGGVGCESQALAADGEGGAAAGVQVEVGGVVLDKEDVGRARLFRIGWPSPGEEAQAGSSGNSSSST